VLAPRPASACSTAQQPTTVPAAALHHRLTCRPSGCLFTSFTLFLGLLLSSQAGRVPRREVQALPPRQLACKAHQGAGATRRQQGPAACRRSAGGSGSCRDGRQGECRGLRDWHLGILLRICVHHRLCGMHVCACLMTLCSANCVTLESGCCFLGNSSHNRCRLTP
jgi:hypothetical protein